VADLTRSSRTWATFAVPNRDGRWYVRFHVNEQWLRIVERRPPVPVRLVEDPAGPYWGWLVNRIEGPVLVQASWPKFEVQFPYGSAAEVAAGRGVVVRLRVEEADLA
jgi:hypothetical protein